MTEAVSKNVWRLLAGGVLVYLSGKVDVLGRYVAIGDAVAGVLIMGFLISGLSLAAIALYRLSRRR